MKKIIDNMTQDYTLYILRGLPGSGKSTLAKQLAPEYAICEADHYFYNDMEYKFDASKLGKAHDWCFNKVKSLMENEYAPNIVLSNTSTTEKEIEPYIKLANEYGYKIVSLILENRHGNKSVHNVPEETIDKMKKRFEIKL